MHKSAIANVDMNIHMYINCLHLFTHKKVYVNVHCSLCTTLNTCEYEHEMYINVYLNQCFYVRMCVRKYVHVDVPVCAKYVQIQFHICKLVKYVPYILCTYLNQVKHLMRVSM